jgi:signal transduction histidine kinase/ActR/RegA family two-component response regulator
LGIARHRYLDILHEFTLRQSALSTLDDIVWNIAKTAIAELGFEDCVVYLLGEDGVTLRQAAAHGPKNPVAREIFNEITIPVGKGIVGHVALTGEVQCIADARDDPRYIEDDDFRLSELAVPISHQGRIIGVLDSEHHEANFFTDEDVHLFTTIAALASTRIDTALAMQRLENTVAHLQDARSALERQALELRRAQEVAEEASRAKTNFLANMSHEIRTPMTAIVGFAELLAGQEVDPGDQVAWRRQLTRNAQYLQDLIGNILDMSAIETGAVNVELGEIPLAVTVADAVEILRIRAEEKGLELRFTPMGELPSIIITDGIKLGEIVVNLVSNAVKYTRQGGVHVVLTASASPEGAVINLAVNDTGIGVAPDQIEHLFVPFNRVHDTKRLAGIEGTGLGLALTHEFVSALGGRVMVESELGVGSAFTVQLPVALAPNSGWAELRPANPFAMQLDTGSVDSPGGLDNNGPLHDRRVLICEDSEPIAALLAALLGNTGAHLTICTDGCQGVEHFTAMQEAGEPPDLVIMDMQMPIMDGYEATGRIKALSPGTPVVALTAFALSEDISRCLEAGCDYYMTKPVNAGRFAGELQNLLHKHEGSQSPG